MSDSEDEDEALAKLCAQDMAQADADIAAGIHGQPLEDVMAELEAGDTSAYPLWWLSFIDPERPKGQRFLGACLVAAETAPRALTLTHVLGINPGGEVAITGPIPGGAMPAGYPTERLLNKAEIERLDRQIEGAHRPTGAS